MTENNEKIIALLSDEGTLPNGIRYTITTEHHGPSIAELLERKMQEPTDNDQE